MRVPIRLTIEVDSQAWADSNGQFVDSGGQLKLADIREDIRTYVINAVQNAPMIGETGAEVRA